MSERKMLYQSLILANWDKVPIVEGRVVDMNTEDIEGRKVPYLTVDTPDGHVKMFESEGLKEAFAVAKPGLYCKVEYLDTVMTTNKRPFRRFRSQVWEEPDAPKFVPPPNAGPRRAARAAKR